MSTPKKYIGHYSYEGEQSCMKEFIFHEPYQISFEFNGNDHDYVVQLLSEDGIVFKGDFYNGTAKERGKVTGVVVTLTEYDLYITGDWFEDGGKGKWYARLTPGENC